MDNCDEQEEQKEQLLLPQASAELGKLQGMYNCGSAQHATLDKCGSVQHATLDKCGSLQRGGWVGAGVSDSFVDLQRAWHGQPTPEWQARKPGSGSAGLHAQQQQQQAHWIGPGRLQGQAGALLGRGQGSNGDEMHPSSETTTPHADEHPHLGVHACIHTVGPCNPCALPAAPAPHALRPPASPALPLDDSAKASRCTGSEFDPVSSTPDDAHGLRPAHACSLGNSAKASTCICGLGNSAKASRCIRCELDPVSPARCAQNEVEWCSAHLKPGSLRSTQGVVPAVLT